MKKALSFLLALLILVSCFGLSAFAEQSRQSGVWTYGVEGLKAVITGYTGDGSVVNVPESLDGYAVSSIKDGAFVTTEPTDIFIPNAVNNIGGIPSGAKVYCFGNSKASELENAKVVISPTDSYSTYVGKSITLSDLPAGATLKSENSALATVSGSKITPVKAGNAKISVSFSNGIKAFIGVKINEGPKAITNVPSSVKLYVNETYSLSPAFSNGSFDFGFTYSSSNAAVAKVNSSGVITALKAGSAKITVKAADLSAVCTVTVGKQASAVTLSSKSLVLGVNETKTLSYSVGSGELVKSVSFKSSNSGIAGTDKNGKITAKAKGTCKITVTTDKGKSASCEIKVLDKPASVYLDTYKKTIGVGETFTLKPSVNSGAACSSYIWRSVDSSKVSVKDGVVTGLKAGVKNVYVLTYNYKDGGSKDINNKCTVTVKDAPSKVSFSKSSITIGVGEKFDLDLVFPSGSYSSKNVNTYGKDIIDLGAAYIVTGKKVGTTTLKVKTYNGKEGTCKITVKQAPKKVASPPPNVKLSLNQTYQLKPYVNKDSACNKYTYIVMNSRLSVSSNGKVTAKDYGACNVYIKTYNNVEYKVSFTVGYITNKLTSYTTKFDPNYYGKSVNLKMAAKYINGKTDGYILQPGHTFSYNKVVGIRTAARGFTKGYVISGGGYVNEMGGGVCQGASTIFNAVLYGNMPILERHQHNLRSSYVPLGRDAAIYWGSQDFKFKNNLNTPIRIKINYNKNGTFNCTIYTLKKVTLPKVELKVTHSGGVFTLKRYANGKVNYTTKSRY